MLDVSTAPPHKGTVLIFTIRATGAWWRHVGENLGFEKFYTVSDIRNDKYCDYNIVADFYRFYRKFYESSVDHAHLLTAEEVTEVRARCRVLRWLPQRKATAMALAMAASYDRVLEATQPNIVVSFPIDRYTSDVLERLAKKRGIPFFELTASAFDNMGMLLYRGQLIRRNASPDIEKVEQLRAGFTEANFTPSYVQKPTAYTRLKWLSVFGYFRLRGWVFKAISVWKRDTLNLHYLDSQSFLEHKPSLSDIGIIDIFDRNWRDMIDRFPKGRRIFIPLQLFPEASIDYWINELDLLFHEDLIFEICKVFINAGYLVLVKDHPLQFGFRQIPFLKKLKGLGGVLICPYDVSGNELMSISGSTFTCTGTLGMQSAMGGLKSIVNENYYSNDEDFVILKSREGVKDLPQRIHEKVDSDDEYMMQIRIVSNLLRGSFECDFWSFQGFDPRKPNTSVASLGKELGDQLALLGPNGENWHFRS